MEKIYIAIDCDIEHRASIYALVTSMIVHKNQSSQYCIYLITNGTSEELWSDLLSLQDENTEIRIWSKSLQSIEETNKIICFQWNLIVTGDLSELYQVDLEDKIVAAAKNIPEKSLNIPNEYKEYNEAVRLLDINKIKEYTDSDYLELSIYYNYGYEEFVKGDSRISNKKIGKKDKTYTNVRDWALVLRYDATYSPEKYFDGPMSEIWLKYYKLSPLKDVDINRISRIETMGQPLAESEDVIPVLLSAEDGKAAYVIACILSMKECVQKDKRLDIRIVYKQLSRSHKEMLTSLIDEKTSIVLYNVAELNNKKTIEFYAAQIFANNKKLICIQEDVLVVRDIGELYNRFNEEWWIGRLTKAEEDDLPSCDEQVYFDRLPKSIASINLINVEAWIQNELSDSVYNTANLSEYKCYSISEILDIVCKKHSICLSNDTYVCEKNDMPEQYRAMVFEYISKTPWCELLEKEIYLYEEKEDDNLKEVLDKINKLEAENKKLKAEMQSIEKQHKVVSKERDQFLYEILEIRKSVTYKIGRMITFLPRLLRGK